MAQHKHQIDRDEMFDMLTGVFPDLKSHWEAYKSEYEDYETDRLDYVDICEISVFIVAKVKSGDTAGFDTFFAQMETILEYSDDEVYNLMVVGLMEGIQNKCSWEKINYQTCFDQWLQPLSKKAWYGLIEFWGS